MSPLAVLFLILAIVALLVGAAFLVIALVFGGKTGANSAPKSAPVTPMQGTVSSNAAPNPPVAPQNVAARPVQQEEKTVMLFNSVQQEEEEKTVMLYNPAPAEEKKKTSFIKLSSAVNESGAPVEYKSQITTTILVGRNNGDIAISWDKSVSSKHCEIEKKEDKFVIRDLGSSNGTFINGNRIAQEETIQNGDVIRLGRTDYQLEIGEE